MFEDPGQQENHDHTIDNEWQKAQPKCEEICSRGMKDFLNRYDDEQLYELFNENDGCVTCIDERVPGDIHIAGSMLLLDVEEARRIVKEKGIKSLKSHAGCGAAAIAYRKFHKLDENAEVSPEAVDQFAIEKTRELAEEELKIEYAGHIEAEQMQGPKDLHIARVIYYHGTPSMKPLALADLPQGFGVSRETTGKENALRDLELSIAIAFGNHGFGPRFTEENPLLVVVVEDPTNTELTLNDLLVEIEYLEEKYEGRVKIDGFTAVVELPVQLAKAA